MLLVKVFQELNKRRVRYLLAGGVAATLYGNPRFTKDLDLFVDLEEAKMKRAIRRKGILWVSEEAISDFNKASITDRLCWLDETRAFLSKVMSKKTKRTYELMRRR